MNEMPIHAIAQRDLKNITSSERSQTRKFTYGMIPFIGNVQNRPVYTDRRGLVIASGAPGTILTFQVSCQHQLRLTPTADGQAMLPSRLQTRAEAQRQGSWSVSPG